MIDTSTSMNDKTQQSLPEQASARSSTASLGARLAAQRQEQLMTIEQVASRLNLAPRQVLAIEEDNYGALPGMASTRGFIRAYAKLLKFDVSPLLPALELEANLMEDAIPLRRPLGPAPFAPGRSGLMLRDRTLSPVLVTGIVLVIAAAILGYAYQAGLLDFDAVSDKPVSAASAVVPAVVAAPTASVAPVAPIAEGSGVSSSSSQVISELAAPIQALPAAALPASVEPALTVKAIADCWVEIRGVNNQLLLSRTIKAGASESFDVKAAVSVVFGNVSGIEATMRGEKLDLRSRAKNNIARLDIK